MRDFGGVILKVVLTWPRQSGSTFGSTRGSEIANSTEKEKVAQRLELKDQMQPKTVDRSIGHTQNGRLEKLTKVLWTVDRMNNLNFDFFGFISDTTIFEGKIKLDKVQLL